MSESAPPAPVVTPRFYQAVCGLALSAIVLFQMQQSGLLGGVALVVAVLVAFIGLLGVYFRIKLSPTLVLLAIGLPQIVEQYYANQYGNPDGRPVRFLDITDVLLCIAALTYFIGHYRLHGLWFGVLPPDARFKTKPGEKPAPPRVRSEESLSVTELVTLVFMVPALVFAAELAYLFLRQPMGVLDLPPRWKQLVLAAWLLLLVMFLVAHLFRHWRRLQMDRVSALLTLQDILWNETRGEQRRINRWLAWKKLITKK